MEAMHTGMLLLNLGLFAVTAVSFACLTWTVYRVLDAPGDDHGPGGRGGRRGPKDPRARPPRGPHRATVRARRDELARSA